MPWVAVIDNRINLSGVMNVPHIQILNSDTIYVETMKNLTSEALRLSL